MGSVTTNPSIPPITSVSDRYFLARGKHAPRELDGVSWWVRMVPYSVSDLPIPRSSYSGTIELKLGSRAPSVRFALGAASFHKAKTM